MRWVKLIVCKLDLRELETRLFLCYDKQKQRR